mmetsp:Transcript_2899/g.5444  ORF Transcript_2899/g.5444 Transcript_2899/m.5444 type:complete len:121 (+) Transcript_2899:2126-2488(+)
MGIGNLRRTAKQVGECASHPVRPAAFWILIGLGKLALKRSLMGHPGPVRRLEQRPSRPSVAGTVSRGKRAGLWPRVLQPPGRLCPAISDCKLLYCSTVASVPAVPSLQSTMGCIHIYIFM